MGSNFLGHPVSISVKRAALAAVTFIAVQAAVVIPARAEFIPPNEVQVKTETLKPDHPQSEFGTYTYDIDWQGIPVATATVTVRPTECGESDPHCLKVRATAKSARGIDIFYRMRHLSESTFREDTLQPVSFVQKQVENSAIREARISWRPDGTVKSHFKKKKDPYDLEFSPNNPMFDPISAAFYAKSVPLSVDASVDVDVFNGRNRFVITFTVVGKEKVTVGEKSVEAFKVVPRVKKLTDTEGEKKFRSGVIWISNDEKREVLKMESEVFIGTVGAELAKFEPSEATGQQPPLPAPESELAAVKARLESAGRAMLEAPHH